MWVPQSVHFYPQVQVTHHLFLFHLVMDPQEKDSIQVLTSSLKTDEAGSEAHFKL